MAKVKDESKLSDNIMSELTIASTLKLHSGAYMPILGLGVFQASNPRQSCLWAFQAGYRHVDSASLYRNEAEVGAAARKSGISREELFLTSKVPGREHSPSATAKALRNSTTRLGDGDKWDLFLLHDPTAGKQRRLEAWKVLRRSLLLSANSSIDTPPHR